MSDSSLNPELRVRLEHLATDCRQRIEQAKPKFGNLPSLKDFPDGACGDASLLLAWHLREHGITEPITYVSSDRMPSHAWIEVEGWLVDITADQRAWGNPPVWILPASQSPFHQKYYPVSRSNADLDQQGPDTRSWIKRALARL